METNELIEVFEAYGAVIEAKVLPAKSDDSKPCGLVRFASVDMAAWVCDNLNGNIPEGLSDPIICRFANAKEPKGGKGVYAPDPYKGKGGGKYGAPAYAPPPPLAAPQGKGYDAKGAPQPAPSDNVWVGDLPPGMDKEGLVESFSDYGQIVDCRMLPGRDENAKPCAMVRFASVQQASWFVENLNGNIPQNLSEPIVCRFANNNKGKGDKGGGGGAYAPAARSEPYPSYGGSYGGHSKSEPKGGGKKGGKMPHSMWALSSAIRKSGILGDRGVPDDCCLFVGNLPNDTTDVDLFRLFCPFGAIAASGVKAMLFDDGSCKGFGFVDYSDPAAAAGAVMALNGFALPDGSAINVSIKSQSQSMKGKGKGW
jgi:RNA recognition motif-containing protein